MAKSWFGIVFAVVIGLFAGQTARANDVVYDQVGRWQVVVSAQGNSFAFCSAVIDNGRARLQIRTDGSAWFISVPHAGRRGNVEAMYGFGGGREVVNFYTEGDGSAFILINADQVNAFRSNQTFGVDIGRNSQEWRLDGSRAAVDKARECARNQGRQQAADAKAGAEPARGRNCPAPGSLRSQNSNRAVTVTFYNGSDTPVTIYWIGYDGQWQRYHTLQPDRNVQQRTFGTHPWVATEPNGDCIGEVFMPQPGGGAENNNFQIFRR